MTIDFGSVKPRVCLRGSQKALEVIIIFLAAPHVGVGKVGAFEGPVCSTGFIHHRDMGSNAIIPRRSPCGYYTDKLVSHMGIIGL